MHAQFACTPEHRRHPPSTHTSIRTSDSTTCRSESDSDSEPPAPPPKDVFFLSPTLHTPSSVPHTPRTPCAPCHARLQARQNPSIPLSLLFPYLPRADLPNLCLVSRCFRNVAQVALYRTLMLSSSDNDDTVEERVGIPRSKPFLFGSPLPRHSVSNKAFDSIGRGRENGVDEYD